MLVIQINSHEDLFKNILKTLLVCSTHIKMSLSEPSHIFILQGFSSLVNELSFSVREFDSVPDQSSFVNFYEVIESKTTYFIFVLVWIFQIFIDVFVKEFIVVK